MPDAAPAARGVYKPRRPQASPLFRLVSDQLHLLQTVYDDRFARKYGPWRPVVAHVAEKCLACGAVLRLFVHLALFEEDQAAGTLTWPHSGFHVHTAVCVSEDDRAFATRLARYCARNPVAMERLTYDRSAKAVTYRSDKSEGPTAGTETVDPLEFLARVLVHIPDKGHGATRIVAFINQASVIDQILTHLRTRAAYATHAGARSPPSTRAPASRGASRSPRPPADAPTVP